MVTLGKSEHHRYLDNNAYAHDGRTQFLNWALSTYGPYDYAGDTRGYTRAGRRNTYDDWCQAGRFMVPLNRTASARIPASPSITATR